MSRAVFATEYTEHTEYTEYTEANDIKLKVVAAPVRSTTADPEAVERGTQILGQSRTAGESREPQDWCGGDLSGRP